MIQNVLQTLGGIANYGILSLVLFCVVFSGVVLWACAQRKTHLDRMAQMPLDKDEMEVPHTESPRL